MRLTAFLLVLLITAGASAQPAHNHRHGGTSDPTASRGSTIPPSQPGQAAFAAIQEIVEILEADPATDWNRVNIEALRQHLIDMDNVTLRTDVTNEDIEGGIKFNVAGVEAVRESIRRMTMAHAATMNGVDGWQFAAIPTESGAAITVRTPVKDAGKLRALGFIGAMTRGMHHQAHHLMLARGGDPHH